jgi:hypothetical protein
MKSSGIFINSNSCNSTPSGSFMASLFSLGYWAAGADNTLLDLGQPWNEKIRIITRGWLIIISFTINFICSISALMLIYDPGYDNLWVSYPTAVCFGAVWSLILFNLSRFIMSAVKASDGQPGFQVREIIALVVQVVVIALISFSTAVPATIIILRSEIKAEFSSRDLFRAHSFVTSIDSPYLSTLDSLYLEKIKLHQNLKIYLDKIDRFDNFPLGDIHKDEEITGINNHIAKIKNEITIIDARILSIRAQRSANNEDFFQSMQYSEGLWSNAEKVIEKSPWTIFYIWIIIILLQASPMFIRAVSADGPYDLALTLQNEITYSKYGILRMFEVSNDSRGNTYHFDQFIIPKMIYKSNISYLRELARINNEKLLTSFNQKRAVK